MNHISFYPSGMMPGSVNTSVGKDLPLITPENQIRYNNPYLTDTDNTRIYLRTILRPIKGLELVGEYTYDRKNWQKSYYAKKVGNILQSSWVPIIQLLQTICQERRP